MRHRRKFAVQPDFPGEVPRGRLRWPARKPLTPLRDTGHCCSHAASTATSRVHVTTRAAVRHRCEGVVNPHPPPALQSPHLPPGMPAMLRKKLPIGSRPFARSARRATTTSTRRGLPGSWSRKASTTSCPAHGASARACFLTPSPSYSPATSRCFRAWLSTNTGTGVGDTR